MVVSVWILLRKDVKSHKNNAGREIRRNKIKIKECSYHKVH